MRSRKLLLAVAVVGVGLALLASAVLGIRRATAPKPEVMPNPNGYADFQQAASLIAGDAGDWRDLSPEALKALVATNSACLRLVRTGLTKPCQVVPYFLNSTNGTHLDDLGKQKRIAQTLCAESRLALLEGRTNDAVSAALDCCRFGRKSVAGGVIIDSLVGTAIRAIALQRLHELQPVVDAPTARRVAATLEEVSTTGESLDQVMAREGRWLQEGRFGPAGFVQRWMALLMNRKTSQTVKQKYQRVESELRRASLDFAERAFELEQGRLPATAEELVPKYLRAVPQDPESGQELKLH